jgi:hypothetical protein
MAMSNPPTVDRILNECDALTEALEQWLEEQKPSVLVAMMALTQVLATVLERITAPDAINLIEDALDKVRASFKREKKRRPGA